MNVRVESTGLRVTRADLQQTMIHEVYELANEAIRDTSILHYNSIRQTLRSIQKLSDPVLAQKVKHELFPVIKNLRHLLLTLHGQIRATSVHPVTAAAIHEQLETVVSDLSLVSRPDESPKVEAVRKNSEKKIEILTRMLGNSEERQKLGEPKDAERAKKALEGLLERLPKWMAKAETIKSAVDMKPPRIKKRGPGLLFF